MLLVHPSMISKIDKYAAETLGIPTRTLMERAGKAVADAVRACTNTGDSIAIFAGKGNNGGDGYAAALELMSDRDVTVYDVFSEGQRSEEGRFFLGAYVSVGGRISPLTLDRENMARIRKFACIVDAVFGTGFTGDMPEIAVKLADFFASLDGVRKIAVDVPLGVDAACGAIKNGATYRADATVVLGFVKSGLVSYPAKEYVGKLIYDNIGLHTDAVIENFTFDTQFIDRELACSLLPAREENSSKGSFGKLMMLTGSSTYPGAAHLSLEAALRSGVGYVTYVGEKELCDTLLLKLPEAIYKPFSLPAATEEDLDTLVRCSRSQSAILVGSGSSKSEGLFELIKRLMREDGAPLVLDADAINVMAENPTLARELIRSSQRKIILTPHPLELSRISGIPTDTIQSNRLDIAVRFAYENNVVLVLKGAGTIITDGNRTYINSTGSSALAKAGSGDVLAGHLAALAASGMDALRASALAVYLHGLAADILAKELSSFGVTPSDLPREIAKCIAKITE